jgi:hypothetical protein
LVKDLCHVRRRSLHRGFTAYDAYGRFVPPLRVAGRQNITKKLRRLAAASQVSGCAHEFRGRGQVGLNAA